jgi:hypothetical protein
MRAREANRTRERIRKSIAYDKYPAVLLCSYGSKHLSKQQTHSPGNKPRNSCLLPQIRKTSPTYRCSHQPIHPQHSWRTTIMTTSSFATPQISGLQSSSPFFSPWLPFCILTKLLPQEHGSSLLSSLGVTVSRRIAGHLPTY